MAVLVSIASGNFTSAATWGVVDATSLLNSEAATVVIGTSNVDSAAFTPGAITVDRIAVKLQARAASPSGTFTVTLRNSSAGSDVTSVTINVSDLPTNAGSWIVLKFGSPQLLLAATNYLVRCVCSASGSQVTLYRNGTANNVSRMLVTTTTAAPGANDQWYVLGEYTGAGTGNDLTVTWDNTATTTWGPSSVAVEGVMVGPRGIWTLQNSATTAYYCRVRGLFRIVGGGIMNVGSSGSRVPADSTFTFEFDCAAAADSKLSLEGGATIEWWGIDKTIATTLTADSASTDTTLDCADVTGWRAGDLLVLSPTGTSISHLETKTIDSIASLVVTLTAGLTNAHKGTGDVICVVGNLTRNVKITSNSTTNRGNVIVRAAAVTGHMVGVEFVQNRLGFGSGNNRLFDYQGIVGSDLTVQKCTSNPDTIQQNTGQLFYHSGAATRGLKLKDCVIYNNGNAADIQVNDEMTTDELEISGNYIFGGTAPTHVVHQSFGTHSIFKNNKGYAIGGTICFGFAGSSGIYEEEMDPDDWSGNEVWYSTIGCRFSVFVARVFSAYLKNWKIYRCTSRALDFSACAARLLVLDNPDFTGNGAAADTESAAVMTDISMNVVVYGGNITGDSSYTSPAAFGFFQGGGTQGLKYAKIHLHGTNLAGNGGFRTNHALADFTVTTNTNLNLYAFVQIIADNAKFGTTPIVSNINVAAQQMLGDHLDELGCFVRAQNYNQTVGDHRSFLPQGSILLDSTVFDTAAPSQKLVPVTASYKLRSGVHPDVVDNGGNRTVTVSVRKSSTGAGDSADYNGNEPRLVCRRNNGLGVTVDTVLDTMTAAIGNWETLTGTISGAADDGVLEFYVDCDGTAGFVNVDDWGR